MKSRTLLTIVLAVTTGIAVRGQSRPHPQLFGIAPTPQTVSNADAFFDDTVMQEVRLTINSRDWQSLKDNYLDNTYYPADFRWRDHTIRNIGIRSRGTGSRSGVKPGLRVDFDRYTGDQKFLGLKSFVLRNNTQDASNLHERLGMLLSRRMGLPASREAQARLYINNAYAGVYSIVESVDKAFLKRTFGEDGGYLFKYDYPVDGQPYFFEDRGADPAFYVPLPFKPETHESDSRPEFIQQLVQAINETSVPAFRSAIAGYLDLQKFLRHVAVGVFLADDDAFLGDFGINNFYFYRFNNQKLFTFIPWDMSEAFSSATYSIWHNINGVPAGRVNRLMAQTLGSRDLFDYYLEALLECARSAAELAPGSTDPRGWLEREIETEYQQIREATLADPEKTFSNDDFEQAVNDLRTFARERGAFIASEVSAAQAQP
ncbi:MAG: CotH kinase family protein [Acidobacteriota bacterium]